MLQVIFQSVRQPWSESIIASVVDGAGEPLPFVSPNLVRAAKEKASQPLYAVVLRLCTAANDSERVWNLMAKLAAPLRLLSNPSGNFLIPLEAEDDDDFDDDEIPF